MPVPSVLSVLNRSMQGVPLKAVHTDTHLWDGPDLVPTRCAFTQARSVSPGSQRVLDELSG